MRRVIFSVDEEMFFEDKEPRIIPVKDNIYIIMGFAELTFKPVFLDILGKEIKAVFQIPERGLNITGRTTTTKGYFVKIGLVLHSVPGSGFTYEYIGTKTSLTDEFGK